MTFCSCSGDIPTLTVDDYDKHLREVLKEVESKIPKVFVNLVLMGNLSGVRTMQFNKQPSDTL
jgi:dihydrodipicolinate synthase/N-acetylneuraminate lyase